MHRSTPLGGEFKPRHDSHGGMRKAGAHEGKITARRWVFLEWLAASELSEQCKILLATFSDLESDAKEPPELTGMPSELYCRGVWTRVQIVLSAYSAITHILWPAPASGRGKFHEHVTRARGAILRKRLGVETEQPVFSRGARNAFEHIAERLDDWVIEQEWPEDMPPGVPTGWSVNPGPPESEPPRYSDRGIRYVNLVSMDVRIVKDWTNLRELAGFARRLLSGIPPQLQVHWGQADAADSRPDAVRRDRSEGGQGPSGKPG